MNYWKISELFVLIVYTKCELFKFDWIIVAKIFIFQLVNFDIFLKSRMTILSLLLTIQLVVYSLLLEKVKFH